MIKKTVKRHDKQIQRFNRLLHELKTPLTIMKGEISLTLKKKRSSRAYKNTLKSSLEEINRMSSIIEDIATLLNFRK